MHTRPTALRRPALVSAARSARSVNDAEKCPPGSIEGWRA